MNHILAATYSQNTHAYVCTYTPWEQAKYRLTNIYIHTSTPPETRSRCHSFPWKEKTAGCKGLAQQHKTTPIPGSTDLQASVFYSLFIFLLFTHATWEETALYNAFVELRVMALPQAWGAGIVQMIKNHNTFWSDTNSHFKCPSKEKLNVRLLRQSLHVASKDVTAVILPATHTQVVQVTFLGGQWVKHRAWNFKKLG